MLRFADACTKDDPLSALGSSSLAATPHALRVLAYVRFCDRAPENGRWSGASSDDRYRILDAMGGAARGLVPENKQALAYRTSIDVSENGAAQPQ
jgi:hypothetical protein